MPRAGVGQISVRASDWAGEWAGNWPAPAASLVFHLMLAGLVFLWPPSRRVTAPPEKGIEVEIVSLPDNLRPENGYGGRAGRGSLRPGERGPANQVSPAPVERALVAAPKVAPEMIRATRMMAADSLADPASRQARLALLTLAEDDRMEQLCAVEAIEQIHAWRGDISPDRLVTYATSDPDVSANTIVAEGAAFRYARRWFTVSFRCEVTPDRERVVAFEFRVGAAVPEEEWERRNLPDLY
ncbi:MAG TPA: DUF930 domain-containing protein [Afifellaceae bacterium]|nr:DUF930 domain-containing protein [Afifellaceae bacterium]